jgi:hypothetical protein
MKNKILLISGCSHAAGSEIDGSQDSIYNRSKSFGNLLGEKIGYSPVNISSLASNNQCISRTILEWFNENYNSDTMEVKVLVAWTESTRMDVPVERITWYENWNQGSDYVSKASRDYIKVNLGYSGSDNEEREIIKVCHQFIVNNPVFMELLSINQALQLQYFFKNMNIDYIMCNTMHMFSQSKQLDFYLKLIDQSKYYNMLDNNSSFYWKFKNLGHINPKAQFWHHNEVPHELFADELFSFYKYKN